MSLGRSPRRGFGSGDRRRGGVVLLGRPTLTTAHAVAQALAVGPIASVALGGLLVARHAGAAAPLVVAVAFAGALSLVWAVSLYARRYAGAGGIYEYISQVHGKVVGIASAAAVFSLGPFGFGALLLVWALLWEAFARAHLPLATPWWAAGALAGLAVFGLQYRGIRLAAHAQLLLTALSAVPFLVVSVAVVAAGGDSGNTVSVFDPTGDHAGNALRALPFAVLLFGGFEAAAALGEEARVPHRSIPRAMVLTVALAGLFYLAVVYAATIGLGAQNVAGEWGRSPVALSVLADRYVGAPLGVLIELAVLVDLLAVLIAYGNAVARGLFALARDGLFPPALGARSRYATPVGGLVTLLVVALAVLAAAGPVEDRFGVFEAVAVAAVLADMVVYLVLSVGAVRFLREERAPAPRWIAIAIATTVPLLGIYATVVPFPAGPARWGLALLLAVSACVVAWGAWLRRRRGETLSRATEYVLRPTEAPEN